jgi:hypothetical protein
MRILKMKTLSFLLTFALTAAVPSFAGQKQNQQAAKQNQTAPQQPAPTPSPEEAALNVFLDRIITAEATLAKTMKNMHPVVETYLQTLDKDNDLTFRPTGDKYFLGKLDLNVQDKEHSFLEKDSMPKNILGKISQFYSVKYLPGGFAQMLVLNGHFDKANYTFEYIRREFIGEVRTIVFDVEPKKGTKGSFKGRIWAEDKDFNIIRFNGTYGPATMTQMFFHFDSWREYVGNSLWLPAYVYTEESDYKYLAGARSLRFKGQTRLWGYNVGKPAAQNELTALIVDSDQVKDNADNPNGISPVTALREWERDAEDNVIHRLEKAALMAPDGEVNKVLETVANNLMVTNNLDIQPEVRARVLLTTPLESFTIGHTIVLSRGLIDVLPDEASLAMIIAHELAHIALGHQIDTKYSFNDRMLFSDPQAFQRIHLKRDEKEEIDADKKAAELLKNSPYKDKLGNAGLFLKAVDQRAPQLDNLLTSHIGNAMVKGSQVQRMAGLMQSAPQLEMAKLDQIAALPLGGRVRVDPWNATIELAKNKPVALSSAREKMPFEISPVFLYLTRQTSGQKQAAAPQTTAGQPQPTAAKP